MWVIQYGNLLFTRSKLECGQSNSDKYYGQGSVECGQLSGGESTDSGQ